MASIPPVPLPEVIQDIADLRTLTMATCGALLERLSRGELPLQVAAGPDQLPIGKTHRHPIPELFLQCRGISRFEVPGGVMQLSAGEALLFPPLSVHDERVDRRGEGFANLVFTIPDRHLDYHLARPQTGQPLSPIQVLADVVPMAVQAPALLGAMATDDRDVRAGCLRAFLALVQQAITTAPPTDQPMGSDLIRLAQAWVRARLDSPELSTSLVARLIGCHPDHLSRRFRLETGLTLTEHITSTRLARARELLTDPTLPVGEVARLTGFQDPAYFCRVYRRRFGISPSADRPRRQRIDSRDIPRN